MNVTLIAVALSTTLMSACLGGDCVKGTGNPVKKELQVPPMTAIVVQGALEVHLSNGATQSTSVEGQQNIIDLLETNVKDGVWTIRTSRCYSTDKPFIVHLTLPRIDGILVQGSGDVISKDTFEGSKVDLEVQGSGDVEVGFQASTITAELQGSGDIRIKGSCDELQAGVQGSGDIKAGGLKATNARARVEGSGDITVQVTGKLVARVSGSGDVKYVGTPASIDQNVNGSGDVKPAK